MPADLEYAKELFSAITPYRKWWSSQASIHAGQDDDFLELAARSGCKQLFLGLEIDLAGQHGRGPQDLSTGWKIMPAIIQRIHAHGIAVQAGHRVRLRLRYPRDIQETMDFLEQTGVQNATFNVLTPFPGTPLFYKLEAEDRMLTRDWDRYNSRADVVFRPKHMSGEELLAGLEWVNQRFYSPASIARRLSHSPVGLWWTLPLNLAYGYRLWLASKEPAGDSLGELVPAFGF